jgi:rRNA-processing protein FCF1
MLHNNRKELKLIMEHTEYIVKLIVSTDDDNFVRQVLEDEGIQVILYQVYKMSEAGGN